ncbi:hypothetical protein DM860_005524 [Cuscuta australis]|uniref:Histidine-containing phosphotransfer protein n=1 Tax=Cuscuta australis TaxID=267555 RepID=A0A328E3C8_9ASTE|nr:hypothetical protein DM860_005524 [Cuscuta australis]
MCHSLKYTSGVTFFVELIATFLTDSGSTLDDMIDIIEYPILDYEKLHELCIKLKGSSACIGACRMTSACCKLIQAILKKSKRE